MVLVTLDEDTVCSGLQLIFSIDADGAEDADKPKSKKAAAAAAAAATLSDKFKVALHELRLIGGDAKAVREAEEKAALDNGGVRDDRPQGDALDPAALILDPNQLNQKALAQVMRRTGPARCRFGYFHSRNWRTYPTFTICGSGRRKRKCGATT